MEQTIFTGFRAGTVQVDLYPDQGKEMVDIQWTEWSHTHCEIPIKDIPALKRLLTIAQSSHRANESTLKRKKNKKKGAK